MRVTAADHGTDTFGLLADGADQPLRPAAGVAGLALLKATCSVPAWARSLLAGCAVWNLPVRSRFSETNAVPHCSVGNGPRCCCGAAEQRRQLR